MGVFAYEAMNSSGQEVKDEIEAATTEEAIAKIRGKGYFPTKVREKAAKESRQEEGRRRRCRAVAKEAEDADLHRRGAAQAVGQFHPPAFHAAGRRSARSCVVCRFSKHQQKPGLLKAIIGGVADEVEGGGTLSDAMAKFPKAFDKLYVNMINAGEVGGVLDLILARLADFMEKAAKLKKKVIGAMIYPAVVISIAVGVVSMIMIVVIPKFEGIFRDFKTDLPGVTKALLAISHWFANAIWLGVRHCIADRIHRPDEADPA